MTDEQWKVYHNSVITEIRKEYEKEALIKASNWAGTIELIKGIFWISILPWLCAIKQLID